ncbi:MAG: DNA mismatch repair protein MutS [Betaproteobacteria bacterium]|nr:MAG: DNA mismatch repair protein MutS [Betaproteobacteria bacterium]
MKKVAKPALEDSDLDLFRQAVADARPLPHHGKVQRRQDAPPPYPVQSHLDEHAALMESLSADWTAQDWLDCGDEPNFLRTGLSRQVLRKLRSGTWVIQDQLDLHGLDRHQARDALAAFLAHCRRRGVRCVRIIHGKGLGSKNREPVLRAKVKHWLAQREEVLAFCQARPTDGGSGALVVLLKG